MTVKQLIEQYKNLSPEDKDKFYEEALRPKGVSGKDLVALLTKNPLDPAKIARMEERLEKECRRTDLNEWK